MPCAIDQSILLSSHSRFQDFGAECYSELVFNADWHSQLCFPCTVVDQVAHSFHHTFFVGRLIGRLASSYYSCSIADTTRLERSTHIILTTYKASIMPKTHQTCLMNALKWWEVTREIQETYPHFVCCNLCRQDHDTSPFSWNNNSRPVYTDLRSTKKYETLRCNFYSRDEHDLRWAKTSYRPTWRHDHS